MYTSYDDSLDEWVFATNTIRGVSIGRSVTEVKVVVEDNEDLPG